MRCASDFRKYNFGMAKAGRPPRDPKSGAAKIVPIRLTDLEKANYQRAANKAGLSLSEWVRDRLGKAAKRETS
jgi:predicted HicB family RNase H-like nuclease